CPTEADVVSSCDLAVYLDTGRGGEDRAEPPERLVSDVPPPLVVGDGVADRHAYVRPDLDEQFGPHRRLNAFGLGHDGRRPIDPIQGARRVEARWAPEQLDPFLGRQ